MKQTRISILAFLLATISFVAFVSAQSDTRRRTPTLTTDDVAAPKHSPVTPAGKTGEAQPLVRRDTQPDRKQINWQRDLNQSLDMARADRTLVIVDVYTKWCGWCRKMDANIYTNPLIVDLSRQEVFLKLDAEDGGQGQQFAREMGVRGYPTTIILADDGRPLKIKSGYIDSAEAFVKWVEQARAAK